MSKHKSPLQSIRFIAAIMIFLRHFVFYNQDPNFATVNTKIFNYFFSPITFFFILSGWSLANAYYTKIKNNTFVFSTYLKKRLLTLYPIHIVSFLLTVLLGWPVILKTPFSITISHVLLLHAFIPISDYVRSYNGVSWCLSIFLFLYLVFPYLMSVIVRFDKHIQKYALGIAMMLFFGLFIWVYTNTFVGDTPYVLYFSPYERLIDFLIGICIFFVVTNIETKHIHQFVWTGLELLAIGIIVAAQGYAHIVEIKYIYDVYFILPWAIVVGVFAISKGYIAKFLSWKPLVLSGSISLEFFLLHNASLRWVYSYVNPVFPMTIWQLLLSSFIMAVIGSIVVHTFLTHLFSQSILKKITL